MEKLGDRTRSCIERNDDYFEWKQLLKIQFFITFVSLENYGMRYVRRVPSKKPFFIFHKNL